MEVGFGRTSHPVSFARQVFPWKMAAAELSHVLRLES